MSTSSQKLIIIGIVFLVLLVFYIVALVRSKKYKLVLTANGWDMAMLLGCPIAFFIAWCWSFDQPLNTVQIVCLVISGSCLIGTIIMSIIHNLERYWDIVISILAKLFIVWLTLIVILLLIAILFVSIAFAIMNRNNNDEDEYFLVKYDRSLRAYVGYRV